jgi:NAD(P)H-flavin reductase
VTAPVNDEAVAPNPWTTARIAEMERIGDRLVRLRLELGERFAFAPGQHCVLRLRAEDGYTAQRDYSIASDPTDPLELGDPRRGPGVRGAGLVGGSAAQGSPW